MIQQLFTIVLLPLVLTQMDIKPDVSFTDTNDRFDITEVIGAQKKQFRDTPLADEEDDDDEGEDYRRQFQKINVGDMSIVIAEPAKTKNEEKSARRDNDEFAYHDNMESGEGGSVSDFDKNLKLFAMQRNDQAHKERRRNADDDDFENIFKRYRRSVSDGEALMQHAVPIVMKVDGYLQAPLQ